MEAFVALITDDELDIVIIEVFLADFAGHILQSFVPLLRSDVSWPQAEVTFAAFGPAETFGQRSAVNIELVIEVELLVLLDVLQREDADADLSQHVPFLGDAVGLAGVVDEPGQVALVGRVDDFSLGGLHEVGAC